jgi:sarcosine oxidase
VLDAVVVGLGAAGSAALYQLARRGANVVGIDRYSPPHALGSSHGDTRITREAIGEGAQYTPLVQRSHAIWRDIERRTGEKLLHQVGGLFVSSPAAKATTHVPRFFENTIEAARRFGIAHEILDAASIRRRFPQFAVKDNESGYYEPTAGYVRPEACVAAQLMLAQAARARIVRDAQVREVRPSNGGVRVSTDAQSFEAKRAIIAAGAWIRDFVPAEIAGRLAVTRQVQYWFEVRGDFKWHAPPRMPVWIWELQDRSSVIYGFPAVDGPGGGLKLATEQYAVTTSADTVTRAVEPAEIAAMYETLVKDRLPALAPRCVRTASCLYTATPDFHFLIDRHPRMDNVILASACSGHGFKHSAALGEALAELVLEGRSRLDLSSFGLQRPALAARPPKG